MKTESFAVTHKRKTLQLLDHSEVRCPRKGPIGNVISVVKCADIFENSPEGCNGCRQHFGARLKAVPLRRLSVEHLRAAPRLAENEV